MPPANSPSYTRPSSPPVTSDPELVTHTPNADTYLRQLEEAISTPVPDLASTLNLSDVESGPREGRDQLTGTDFGAPRNPVSNGRGANLWERQPAAGREVVDEDRTLAPTAPTQTFTRLRHPADVATPNWVNGSRPQAAMQNQRPYWTVQRQNYATTGGGPVRESLYDWAVPAPMSGRDMQASDSGDESDEDMDHMSTAAPNNDINARRDLQRLERALQSYRSARNALRTGRTGDLLGAVPTASALRAYWYEESNDNATTSGFQSQYRFERQRRHAEYARLNAEANAIFNDARFRGRKEPKRSEAFDRVRNSIRYLSRLRHTGVEGGLILAKQLDLDYLYEDERANTPSDLPMHVNSLPIPQYSSWLAPGMVWQGLQSTDREPVRSSTVRGSEARRERHRELFRRTLARRREMVLGNDVAEEFSGSLLDAERYLSDLLQDSNGRWGFARASSSPSSQPNISSTPPTETDHWPVKVTIHSVDYDTMTLTGTMSASHMPEKMSSAPQSTSPSHNATTSMSSFFTGEIIDFRRHPLETEAEDRNYRVGGVDVDASYWARLGPFRKEIEKARSLRGKRRSEYQQDSPLWEAFRKAASGESENKEINTSTTTNGHADSDVNMSGGNGNSSDDPANSASIESEESQEMDDDKVMARCLGSARWLDEKIGKEWILMRWKERCFVDSPSNSNQTRTIVTAPYTYSTSPTGLNRPLEAGTNNGTSWGLTISGFYYIALNRLSGEIDGLYYDPGSQPYQALRMAPEGMSMPGAVGGAGARSQQDLAPCTTTGNTCGCGEGSCKERVGLKRWFPSMELR